MTNMVGKEPEVGVKKHAKRESNHKIQQNKKKKLKQKTFFLFVFFFFISLAICFLFESRLPLQSYNLCKMEMNVCSYSGKKRKWINHGEIQDFLCNIMSALSNGWQRSPVRIVRVISGKRHAPSFIILILKQIDLDPWNDITQAARIFIL